MQLDFFQDPGHGWIKAPKALLEQLGIANEITPYSYQRGNFAYLEEDCDASTLLEAARKAGVEITLRSRHCDRESRIRAYEGYERPMNKPVVR